MTEPARSVDLKECRWRICKCGVCAVCGHPKHTAIHGPFLGEPPGGPPWGHQYVPMEDADD